MEGCPPNQVIIFIVPDGYSLPPQVNLVENFIIAGVASQGQKHFDGWVTSYSVSYSVNHQLWDEYPVDGRSKTV